MLGKEEIENNRIPTQLAKALGVEKEDTDSLIAFKESLYEQTVKENVKLKKQVKQLEKENNMFKDFYINCGNKDIAENITATQYSKIMEKGYWQGYIQKQNEAMEICKQCKYKNKTKKLESDKQKLIKKLEEDIKKNNEFEFMPLQIEKAYNNYYKLGKIDEAQEILGILKGENDVKRNN